MNPENSKTEDGPARDGGEPPPRAAESEGASLRNVARELELLHAELRNIDASMNTPVLVVGRDLLIRRFTPTALKGFGLSPRDVGRSLATIPPLLMPAPGGPATANAGVALDWEALVRGVITTGGATACETRDSNGRWFSLRVSPYLTGEKQIDGAVLILVDIDALKRTGTAAQQALDYAEAILRTTRGAMVIVNSELRIHTANAAFYRLFPVGAPATEGHPMERLLGGAWNDTGLRTRMEGILAGGRGFDELEIRWAFPTWGSRRLLINGQRLEVPGMNAPMILLAIEDATERLSAEAALRESEERYRTLFNSMDEGFCIVKMIFAPDGAPVDYRFLEVNPSFDKQSGLAQATGRTIRELAPNLEAHWFEMFGRVARTGEPVRFVNEAKTLGRWFDVYSFRLGAPESVTIAILFSDTSAKRHIAIELERVRDEAVAASRAKDEFLAALSHELRTPLNPILLLAGQGSRNPYLPSDARADFEMIRANVVLEARLIDDLLDLTRVARGTMKIDFLPADVHAVLRDSATVVKGEAEDKGIRLEFSFNAARSEVLGDSVRLQQLFWNILRNAIHFTPPSGRISITTRNEGTRLLVIMRDTGIGIIAADLMRIFDAFAQAKPAVDSASRSGGLGLGLAISKKIAELHHGSIHAESPGLEQGSSFVVSLPLLAEDHPRTPVVAVAIASPDSRSPLIGESYRILIVDDHAATLGALRQLLQRPGVEVKTARSVAEALEQSAMNPFQVVISDIGLPDGDGHSLMARLRAAQPQIQGIALSGYGTLADIEKSRAAGFAVHLVKPVEIGELEDALERLRS